MNVSYRIFPEGSIINTRPCVHEERTMIWLKAKEEKKTTLLNILFVKGGSCFPLPLSLVYISVRFSLALLPPPFPSFCPFLLLWEERDASRAVIQAAGKEMTILSKIETLYVLHTVSLSYRLWDLKKKIISNIVPEYYQIENITAWGL